MQLVKKQKHFLDIIKSGEQNVFLTGKAGTGKSFVVKKAMEYLKNKGITYLAVAPTGIAAQNIQGATIHSTFSLSINGVLTFESSSFVNSKKRKVLDKCKYIFIDEVSMLRPDIMDAINWTLVKNGLKDLTTKNVIFVGDLKQLPPPLNDNTKSVLLSKYSGFTFEHSSIYKKLNVKTIELDEVIRQSDPDFIKNLNIIREGGKSEYFKQFINEEPKGVVLACHNSTVKEYNQKGLDALKGKKHVYKAKLDGEAKPYDFSLEPLVELKNGAKIMYLVNSDAEANPLVNGTIGEFQFKNGEPFIVVDNVYYLIEEVTQTKKEYVFNDEKQKLELKEVGSIEQIPVKLAYALTVHKSQGLTFKEMTFDLRRPPFQKGQLYTALSRCASPEGLRIKIK